MSSPLPSPGLSAKKKASEAGGSTPTKKKWKNLFRRKDSSKGDDTDPESPRVSFVGEETDAQKNHNAKKPHPLLRPRSLVGMSGKLVHGDEEEAKSEAAPLVKPQFGVPLAELAVQFPEEPVPAVLVACVEILEADIRKEGMFRIPGRMTSIVEMKNSFEAGNGLGTDEPETLEIAGLVAQFFRELPEPLLTYNMYYKWIDAAKKENEEEVNAELRALLGELEPANLSVLRFFIQFLATVNKSAGANRMSAKNLGLVFGASLLNPPSIDQYDLANIKLQCLVVERMIISFGFIFEGAESDPQGQKTREKAVATIPAGNPAAKTKETVPAGPDRRKGFMKRKSTFFASNHYSGSSSRIANVISLVNRDPKDKDSIEQNEEPREKRVLAIPQQDSAFKKIRKKATGKKKKDADEDDLPEEDSPVS